MSNNWSNPAENDKLNTDKLKQDILTSSHIHNAIKDYLDNESEFSEKDSYLIRTTLFNKLISSNPLGLLTILYNLKDKMMTINEISNTLEKKGGSIKTVQQWMDDFENLGYVDHKISSKKLKSLYCLKKPVDQILKELPPSYYQLIEENLEKDNVYLQNSCINYKEANEIIEYINGINKILSFVTIHSNKDEPLEITTIIKTLLNRGATITEAFYVLDGVSKELEYLSEIKAEKNYFYIQKEDLPKIIKNVLEYSSKPEMDHLLYWYTASDIIKETGIKHSENAEKIIMNEILKYKWKKTDSRNIYFYAFKNVYGYSYNNLINKNFLLDKIDNFLKEAEIFTINDNLKNNNVSKHMLLNDYRILTRNIALSIQINIGYLGSNEYPVQNLINVIKAHSPTLKLKDLNNPYEFIMRLRNPRKPLSKFLYNKFPPNIQYKIDTYEKNDELDISFKRELINIINSIITSKHSYNQIKELIDISPALQQLLTENIDDAPYMIRLILDDFFSDSIISNSLKNKIRRLQLHEDYKEFILALEFAAYIDYKNKEKNYIEIQQLISYLEIIKKVYKTLDFVLS